MEYSYGFTTVALEIVLEMLKSRIQKSSTIRAIKYELDLNLDFNGYIGFGLENWTKNQCRNLSHRRQ